MTKRKPNPERKARPLTDDQVKVLGDFLLGTTRNVYRLSESMFGTKVDDKIFPRIQTLCGIFHCEHCGEWQLIKEELSDHMADTCRDCEEEIFVGEDTGEE